VDLLVPCMFSIWHGEQNTGMKESLDEAMTA